MTITAEQADRVEGIILDSLNIHHQHHRSALFQFC